MSSMRLRVSALTDGLPRKARETVGCETPARYAMSNDVGFSCMNRAAHILRATPSLRGGDHATGSSFFASKRLKAISNSGLRALDDARGSRMREACSRRRWFRVRSLGECGATKCPRRLSILRAEHAAEMRGARESVAQRDRRERAPAMRRRLQRAAAGLEPAPQDVTRHRFLVAGK